MGALKNRKQMARLASELGLEFQPGEEQEEHESVGRITGTFDGYAVEISPDDPIKFIVILQKPLPVFLEMKDTGRGARGRLQPFHFGNRVIDGVLNTCLAKDELRDALRSAVGALEPCIRRLGRRMDNFRVTEGRIRAWPRGSHNPDALGRENRLTEKQVHDCLPCLVALARSLDAVALPAVAGAKGGNRSVKKHTGARDLEVGLPRPAEKMKGLLVTGILIGVLVIGFGIEPPPAHDVVSYIGFFVVGPLASVTFLALYYRLRRWSRTDPRVRFGASEVDIPALAYGRNGLRLRYVDVRSIEVRNFTGGRQKAFIETATGTRVLTKTYFGTVFDKVVGELGCRARLNKDGKVWHK
jgi:hypothetical protein